MGIILKSKPKPNLKSETDKTDTNPTENIRHSAEGDDGWMRERSSERGTKASQAGRLDGHNRFTRMRWSPVPKFEKPNSELVLLGCTDVPPKTDQLTQHF